jgi:hypothetical protein
LYYWLIDRLQPYGIEPAMRAVAATDPNLNLAHVYALVPAVFCITG